MIHLDSAYSATRHVTKEMPVINKQAGDKFESILFLPEGEGRQGEGGLRAQGYFKSSLVDKPVITVITVVFNGEQFLEKTILSVINQSYDNMEYIIIDAGSMDGTLNIIRKYEHALDYWVSEKDRGIYDAMNKGLRAATGKYIFFMGADDVLINDGINQLFNRLQKNIEMLIAVPVKIKGACSLSFPNIKPPLPVVHHQGAILNVSCLKKIGLYSEKYKVHSDFDLMTRYIGRYGIKYVNSPICIFRKGGKSTSGLNLMYSVKELLAIYFINGGEILSIKWVMFILRPLYYFVSRIAITK